MTITRVFPAVTSDLVSPPNSSSGQNHGLGTEQVKSSALAVISKRTRDALTVFEQPDDCVFHENVQTEMDSMVLQCADHLQARSVTDMRQPRIPMTPEITLQDPPIVRTIEKGTPCFQFSDACRSFLCVQFCHSPVAQVLAPAHRVGKVNAPAIAIVHVSHRCGNTTLRHDGVRFAEEGLRNDGNPYSSRRGLDRSTQPGTSRSYDEN